MRSLFNSKYLCHLSSCVIMTFICAFSDLLFQLTSFILFVYLFYAKNLSIDPNLTYFWVPSTSLNSLLCKAIKRLLSLYSSTFSQKLDPVREETRNEIYCKVKTKLYNIRIFKLKKSSQKFLILKFYYSYENNIFWFFECLDFYICSLKWHVFVQPLQCLMLRF